MAVLRKWLYQLVSFVARFHDSIVDYNQGTVVPFTDKELHFIVIGLFGLLLFLLVLPLFRFLTRRGRYGLMTWLFTFSTVLFVVFAIEVGQQLTRTSWMQMWDIVYGIAGFLAASVLIALGYLLLSLIRWLFRKEK